MDINAEWARLRLDFRFEARTSRESMRYKDTYIVRIHEDGHYAYGECALFHGLSEDDKPDYEKQLDYYCRNLNSLKECRYSSIRFGLETALANLKHDGADEWNNCKGIPINGLIWMGDKKLMARRIDEKLADGFRVLKLKIGGINFEDELDLLEMIRQRYAPSNLEIRLDANGSFSPENALNRLYRLSSFGIHSIEQPIKAGLLDYMRTICSKSPIPIALDEDLIGCTSEQAKHEKLRYIQPSYIILKPALCGGLSGAQGWADAAEQAGIQYWFTSALESNIGLDSIARLAIKRGIKMPQGLGTGELYHNNIPSPLYRDGAFLRHDAARPWIIPDLKWNTPIS